MTTSRREFHRPRTLGVGITGAEQNRAEADRARIERLRQAVKRALVHPAWMSPEPPPSDTLALLLFPEDGLSIREADREVLLACIDIVTAMERET